MCLRYPVRTSSPPAPESKTFIPFDLAIRLINKTFRAAGSAIGSSRIEIVLYKLLIKSDDLTSTSNKGNLKIFDIFLHKEGHQQIPL